MDGQTEDLPKFEVHKCVVCNGFGTLKYGAKTCQGCIGRGFVTINSETGLPVEDGRKDGRQELDKTI